MLEWCKVLLLFKTQGKKKKTEYHKAETGQNLLQGSQPPPKKEKKKNPAPEEQGNKTSVPQHWGKGLQPSRHRWIVSQ